MRLRVALSFALFLLAQGFIGSPAMADKDKAEEAIRESADQEDAHVQLRLGLNYLNGDGVPQNYMQAVGWFRKAADQGNARAQSLMGRMYYEGKGVRKNRKKGLAWFRKAAYRGDAEGVGHGRTGEPEVNIEDAEFILNSSAALIVYLARLYGIEVAT